MVQSDCKWLVYIIELSDGSYYTGITTDLDKRLLIHSEGKGSKYVKSRLPIKNTVYVEGELDESAAKRREYEIKQMSKKRKKQL